MMWRRYAAVALAAALSPVAAYAQADNTNSLTEPAAERAKLVVASATETTQTTRALPRWWRDESRRRERPHALGEGLTPAELGLLYGVDFTMGETADWPTPVLP